MPIRPYPRDRYMASYSKIKYGGLILCVGLTLLILATPAIMISPDAPGSVLSTVGAGGGFLTFYGAFKLASGLLMRRRAYQGRDPITGDPDDRIRRKVESHEPDQYADQPPKQDHD